MPEISSLLQAAIDYDSGDLLRIHHLLKVHGLARLIAQREGLDDHTRFITEAAAAVHDIGIHVCEEKFGCSGGKLQEQEGPAVARRLLESLGFSPLDTDRICFLVGHHHTYAGVDGPDWQILLEADFLVNLYEDGLSRDAGEAAGERMFRTETGKALLRSMLPKAESS